MEQVSVFFFVFSVYVASPVFRVCFAVLFVGFHFAIGRIIFYAVAGVGAFGHLASHFPFCFSCVLSFVVAVWVVVAWQTFCFCFLLFLLLLLLPVVFYLQVIDV